MSKERLLQFLKWENLADHMDDAKKIEISQKIFSGWDEDKRSRKDWLDKANKVMDMALMKNVRKDDPWPNAANVKFPLISTAMLQSTSRILPDFIKNGEVIKYRILGLDPDGSKERRAVRNKIYINNQLLNKMEDWVDSMERLFNQVSIIGTCFVKTYWDPIEKLNKSELMPYDLITVNDYIPSLKKAPRITEAFYLTKNECVERIRSGLYSDVDMNILAMEPTADDRSRFEFIEQHCWEDLDGDGYEEPYIAVLHVQSRELLRMVPRFTEAGIEEVDRGESKIISKIHAIQMFTDYHFIHSPNGRFHSIGFGMFLFNTSSMVDSVLNALIDAGTLATTQTGFITKAAKMRETRQFCTPGKLNEINITNGTPIKDNIEMLQFKEPSPTLFQLLGLLVESAKTFTSTTEALTGTADTQNASPNAVLAMIKQGLTVFNATSSRLRRSFEKTIKILMQLNSEHVNEEEYLGLLDIPQFIQGQDPQTGQPIKQNNPEFMEMYDPAGNFVDFSLEKLDFVPVADLNTSTEQETLLRTQAMMQYAQQMGPMNVLNLRAISREAFRALGEREPDKYILPEPPPPDPNMNPEIIKLKSEIDKTGKELELKNREMTLKEREFDLKERESLAKIKQMMAQSVKALSDADTNKGAAQLEVYKHALEKTRLNSDLEKTALELDRDHRALDLEEKALAQQPTESAGATSE